MLLEVAVCSSSDGKCLFHPFFIINSTNSEHICNTAGRAAPTDNFARIANCATLKTMDKLNSIVNEL